MRAFVLTAAGEGAVREDPGRPGWCAGRAAGGPASSLHALPDEVDPVLGALVEPGGNALRAAQAADLRSGDRVLVLGPGTIGLLVAMFACAAGAEVHLLGRTAESLDIARSLGFGHAWTDDSVPDLPFDAVVDASNAAHLPARALDLVEPAGRVVYVGLAGGPSRIDTRALALKDVTAVGILSASPGLDATIAAYASGAVDPRPLVAATVGLDQVAGVLAGARPEGAGRARRSTSTHDAVSGGHHREGMGDHRSTQPVMLRGFTPTQSAVAAISGTSLPSPPTWTARTPRTRPAGFRRPSRKGGHHDHWRRGRPGADRHGTADDRH